MGSDLGEVEEEQTVLYSLLLPGAAVEVTQKCSFSKVSLLAGQL